eukprot:TRINITY_DN15753_c0_g1_i1.p1 TRINITY_DN15753_c0_g1~~TRINITY_DN15753_c0_g1_i1.p1  ORF type:complete len:149 (+),score=18.46 TRINITY_DN15753_c0_g1_i1:41-448(+)
MAPHFVLAWSVFYAARAVRRDVDTSDSDMRIRATGTINGLEVAQDKTLFFKKGDDGGGNGVDIDARGHNKTCVFNFFQCGGTWLSRPWGKLGYPTKCCDPSHECFKFSKEWSVCQPPKSAKPGEPYDDKCAPHGG